MADVSIVKKEYDEFRSCSNDVIKFKLIRRQSDIDDESTTFSPDMTHQFFGEGESIFGYRDLSVNIYYAAASLNSYINMKYGSKISDHNDNTLVADEVIQVIVDKMGTGVHTNVDEFVKSLDQDESFVPYGQMLHSYNFVTEDNTERQFEVYRTAIDERDFRDYHSRLQTFLLFYVDAASFIDVDDEKWMFYLTFEKYLTSEGSPRYAIVGYMTVYNYYAYPEQIRPRISQAIILPPFQGQGHCSRLLQTFYKDTYGRREVLDITVEDPSENFQRVRDLVDARNCQDLTSYQRNELLRGFTNEMAQEAREKLKLNKKQAQRIYEILRLLMTDESDREMFRQYRLSVKQRLNAPFQKNGFGKLIRSLQGQGNWDMIQSANNEARLSYLDKEFNEHLTVYRLILDRLKTFRQ